MTNYGFACQTANPSTTGNTQQGWVDARLQAPGHANGDKPLSASLARVSNSETGHEDPSREVRSAPERPRKPIGQPNAWESLGRVDPQGRWVFFCQAAADFDTSAFLAHSRGARSAFLDHAFLPYFSLGNAEATPAQALLAASPDGRYIVLARNQVPELVDAETGTVLSLAARDIDLRADAFPGDLRSIAFSPMSDKVAFVLHEKQQRVIILDLRNSSEAEVIPVSAMVWRIAFDASGRYLVLQEIPEDSNLNGKIAWPVPERKLADTRCRTPVPAFAAYTPNGDLPQTSLAPIAGGKANWVSGFITGLGHSVVVKSSNGALSAIEGTRRRGFGSSDCNAQIVAVAPEYARVLVGCRDTGGRARLELDTVSSSQKLDLDVPNSNVDRLTPESTPFTVVYSGARTALIEWSSARVLPLEDRDQVLAQGQAGIVLHRGAEVILYVPATKSSLPLLDKVSSGTRIVMGDGVVVVGNVVVSAKLGRVVGKLNKPALAVDASGCGLVSLNDTTNGPFPRGPLGWRCPLDL